ncbi:unnamed protein product [Rotaria sp. Silwood1]|nr:unnamed protein product [Rotaria sp. Silwood1]
MRCKGEGLKHVLNIDKELEEIETFADIPFTSTDKDFLTKHSSIDITNKINELITFDNNEKFKSLHEISLKLSITVPSDIIPSIEETLQQQIDENKQFVDVNSPKSNTDEQRTKDEEKFREKIKRKTRLVQLEKIKQGNTVIHHRVDLSKHVLLVPQRATYEENLEPIPPLIHVKDTTNFSFNEMNIAPLKSKRSLPVVSASDTNNKSFDVNTIDHQKQKSEMKLSSYSTTILSPVQEEPEEIQTSEDIPFTNITNKINELITFDNNEKLKSLHEIPLNLSITVPSDIIPSIEETLQQQIDENKQVTVSYSSLLNDLSSRMSISQRKDSIISQSSKGQKIHKQKSLKKKRQSVIIKQIEAIELVPTINDESLSTQVFNIEQEIQSPIPITSESKVIYHKVGVIPRKAVPFISATQDKQIDVEDDPVIKYKKKKRKRSSKSTHKYSRSRSSSKKENIQIESKSINNQDAIAMHLLNVKRFTIPPISAINFDQTRHKYNDNIEIKNEKFEQSRLHLLKPMIKNFELDNNFQKHNKEIQNIDAYDLDKELFDFNNDTKEIDQPAMFSEYIPEFFQKQAEEKQIRRISLTAIKTDEDFIKRLAPRVSHLYNGWQPSDTIFKYIDKLILVCAHTDEFHPLNKYLMSDISYYFDDDFIDESGLFQNQRNLDKMESRIKQPTQRFRDDYIVKEFFHCWKDYTVEQARIAELRRKRITIDFREFWFQDAISDSFYSYFEQPLDYIKKQDNHHQMAYRLHKRLVRTGREQPKETMNNINRSSFLPILFNLPKNNLDRQISLSRRRQLINYDNNDNKNYFISLSNLITHNDEILSLIRERIHFLNRTKTYINIHRDELAIKELLLNSSLLQRGTIKDLDKLIIDYYASIEQQNIKTLSKSSSSIVKLPMLRPSPLIYKSNSKLSRQSMTISQ